MKNLILADFAVPEKWQFKGTLEKRTGKKWNVLCMQSNLHHGGLRNVVRYAQYFYLPFRVFCHKKGFASVLAWQQFYGLILAFYFRIFRVKTGPDIFIMTFIYRPKASLIGKLFFSFVRYALNCNCIQKVFVYSENEVEHYTKLFGLPKDIFTAVKLGVEDENPQLQSYICDGGYYISAGRSNRDYTFLLKAWEQQNKPLKIVCDTLECGVDANIQLLNNCYGQDYLRELAGCRAVIVPLENEEISSGQLVVLHAMMLGKPVIITKNRALEEYILDGETGFVIEKKCEALESALMALEDGVIYSRMSESSRKHYVENYTEEKLGDTIGKLLLMQ